MTDGKYLDELEIFELNARILSRIEKEKRSSKLAT